MAPHQEQKILERFRQGKAPAAVKRAASRGTMPVAADELLEILVLLTRDPDPTCSEVAQRTLASWPAEKCAQLLAQPHISAQTLEYFACQPHLPDAIAAVVAAHPHASEGALTALAPRLTLEQLQPLLADEARLKKLPGFIAATLQRSHLPADMRTKLEALRSKQRKEEQEEARALAVAVAKDETEAEKRIPEQQRLTLTQKLANMSTAERVQTALKGTKEERLILVRDRAKIVYRAVLESPKLTDSEVESFASMKNVAEDVLRIIAGTRKFMKNYIVVRNLINNPRTPIDISLPLLTRLINQDLKYLTRNRNVPETIRNAAIKLHKQRSEVRTSY